MNTGLKVNAQPDCEPERRNRRRDRRRGFDRRKGNDLNYKGPYRRMQPDRRQIVLDRRAGERVASEGMQNNNNEAVMALVHSVEHLDIEAY